MIVNYILSQFSEPNQERIILSGKIAIAASVIAGLALATFYTSSLANAAYAEAVSKTSTANGHELLQVWGKAGALTGTAGGLGIATLIAPIHAFSWNMFKSTAYDELETKTFLFQQIIINLGIVIFFRFVAKLDYVQYAARIRLLDLKK